MVIIYTYLREISLTYVGTAFTVVNLFLTFSLSELLKNTPIIATSVTPGYCNSELTRHFVGVAAHATQMMQRLFARTAEEGARQLVFGAVGEAADPQKLRGAYISLHKVLTPSDHMLGDAGMARRDALWVRVLNYEDATPRQ